MSEKGCFRVSFRGFHKDDVLQYIDELKADHTRALAALERRCVAAEESITGYAEEAKKARADLEEARKAETAAQEQAAKLTALAKAYKQEILRLRESAERAESEKATEVSELDAANQKIRELTDENALLTEQNKQYASVVGDMNSLVTQARVLSESYFENAHQRSVDIVDRLDTFLDDMKTQTQQNRFLADVQKQKGEVHIESLLSELKRREDGSGSEES